jgi:23S rRNA (cytidine1920-2'-O)/16S rRNA (cytidine1409-2'-O)-methyltransferase
MAKQTVRLDTLLVERGLLPSRQAAQAAIMDGGVIVDGNKVTKPGTPVNPQSQLQLTSQWQVSKYVSRGGLKLEKALEQFGVSVGERICLDIGASTGGFTDCLLQNNARHVFAIDVGYGQLDWKLRQDERVTVKERVNARYLNRHELYGTNEQAANLAVFDLSFISITKVLPAVLTLLEPCCDLIALIKPQFEAGKEAVGKGGVVKNAMTHEIVLKNILDFAATQDLATISLTYSPVKGPAGNIEFLAHWHRPASDDRKTAEQRADLIKATVDEAHRNLSGH